MSILSEYRSNKRMSILSDTPIDQPSMPDDLTKDEQLIFHILRDSVLGREGMILGPFFSSIRGALQSMVDKGVVRRLPEVEIYSAAACKENYGLVGEEYPENEEDWSFFRGTEASLTMTYGDFRKTADLEELQARAKWLWSTVLDLVGGKDTDFKVQDYIQIHPLFIWDGLLKCIYKFEDDEEALIEFVVEAMNIDYFTLKSTDEKRFKKLIAARIKHNDDGIASIKAELATKEGSK